jgi:hypothetical protein
LHQMNVSKTSLFYKYIFWQAKRRIFLNLIYEQNINCKQRRNSVTGYEVVSGNGN